jgi:phosphatidylserine decarboxylase
MQIGQWRRLPTPDFRLWIKGREFTLSRLLGDVYKYEAHRYIDGAPAIF